METFSADVLVIGGGFSAQMAVRTLIRHSKQMHIVMATPAMSGRDYLPLHMPEMDIFWEKRYQDTIRAGAGPVREQSSIEAALQTVSRLQHELNELPPCPKEQWFSRMRLENDLIAARLTLLASLERRESVGVFQRSDHPEKAKSPYRVRLQLTGMLLFPEKEAWGGSGAYP